MKKNNKKYSGGSMTLEILLAFAILIFCLTAVISISFGNQSITVDSETNTEAISIAKKTLEDARSLSRQNYLGVIATTSTETLGGLTYTKVLEVVDVTPCKKQTTSTVTWLTGLVKTQEVEFTTFFTDIAGALALGGDCAASPPGSNWDSPERFASDTFSPGKPTSIDVLNKIVVLGVDKDPFVEIADTKNAYLSQNFSDPLFLPFMNGFSLGDTPNGIDAINWTDAFGVTKKYAFFAISSTTNQLLVVDITDVRNPVLKKSVPLSSCVAGSAPQGWRLYAYKDRLYFLTRFTAGPEFHIFDISSPINPIEFGSGACKGFELGDTSESIEVRDQNIGGTTVRFVYLATDENDKELRVLNVTNPLAITEVTTATQDLTGNQDGQSVYIVGNKLYFGRQSNPSGPDLYIYDISNPVVGLTLIGSQDINTGVLGIRVAGPFAFLATPKVNKEFQIWNISNLSSISLIKEYNFGNVVNQGIDYEYDFIYATGQSTPNFQILYDSTP